ncbi:hypothetical protein ACQKNX_24260 [Lysinibacillus sp. NPDC093712]|uniref:hypothetical protein n=1 Tax=Lysinibacillus sp. NPDC093712 TaxID=3390579 RepID=UPI003D03244D
MAGEIYFNSDIMSQAMARSVDATARGLRNGLTDVKNDWKAESVDAAPIDTSNLRQQITAEVFTEGSGPGVEISANATRGSRRFNYAFYIHEEDAGGANVNGEKKFLDRPAQQNQEKWARWIEEEVGSELRRAGW